MKKGEGQLVTMAALNQLFFTDEPAGTTTAGDFPIVG